MNKRISIYDFNPRFFKDFNNDGIGDLLGIIEKSDYFSFLKVDFILIQDIFDYFLNSENKMLDFTISSEIGNFKDLKILINKLNKNNIGVFLELDFKKMTFSEEYIDFFINKIIFLDSIGVQGFSFKNFEFLNENNNKNIMDKYTIEKLELIYKKIKFINPDIQLIGKSSLIHFNDISLYLNNEKLIFDYFQSSKFAFCNISEKFGTNISEKFNSKKLTNSLKNYANNKRHILSFGNEKIGRISSRWGNDDAFHKESVKCLFLLNMLSPASFTIYCGDEIGSKNLNITYFKDFHDENWDYKENKSIKMKISEKDFISAQSMLNPINASSPMMWNNKKNGGFSNSDNTIVKIPFFYKENNLENQFKDKNSIFHFCKNLNLFIKNSYYKEIIEKGVWGIKNCKSTIIMNYKYDNKEIQVYVNLSKQKQKIWKKIKGKVLFSTYDNKEYPKFILSILPYEGFVIYKENN